MANGDKQLLREVQHQIASLYPEIRLESAVQGYAYLGEFSKGIATYDLLDAPTAADDRWLGVCFFQEFEDMRAQEAFYRALSKGEEAARVNLAHLLRFLERSEEAASELVRVDTKKLRPYDEVLFLRVSSLHEETNGNIRKAIEHAELAWDRVQGLPEYQILAPSVLAQLGILYGRMGEARKALWYFDRGIKLTDGLEQKKVTLRRITLLLNLGRFEEVEAELKSLEGLPEGLSLERDLLWGDLYWSRGKVDQAIGAFSQVADTAVKLASGSDEFSARLALAALYSRKRDFDEAEDNIASARILISDKSDVLLHRYREILLLVGREQYGVWEAASELEMLAEEFRNLGTLQEEACVRLQLAQLYRDGSSDTQCRQQLAAVRSICSEVNNRAFLRREWILVPDLEQVVLELEPDLVASTTSRLEVTTVGDEGLFLDGRAVFLPMRRSVELLAYFLENRVADLSRVLKDLFPNVKPRTGRSYFHQFRHQLRQHVPGLEISFNQSRKVYELRYEIEIAWDVERLRRGEGAATFGRFLPSSSSAWISSINQELDEIVSSTSKTRA